MTRDDIIRMAQEAGFKSNAFAAVMAIRSDGRWIAVLDEVTRFAGLVAAAEREAIERLIQAGIDSRREEAALASSIEARNNEDAEYECDRLRHWSDVRLWNSAHEKMLAAIRARGAT